VLKRLTSIRSPWSQRRPASVKVVAGNVASMLRRSFRVGLTLGLLAGVALAVLKMMQGRREHATVDSSLGPDRWQPPPPQPPRPAPPAPPEGRTEVVRSPVRPPDDVPHVPPAVKEDVRPSTVRPDEDVEAVAVPAPPPEPPEPPPPAKRAAKKSAKSARKTARKTAKKAAPATAWVEPSGSTCPPSHPIKAKLSSRIFHAPGQLNYDRTAPDRCYRDEGAAEGDGLRQSKR